MNEHCINVLFLSSGNSTRSIMAEAILRHRGGARFCAYSAGSHPTGRVNPLALEQLRQRGYPIDRLASKSWTAFSGAGAPRLHLLIGVCGKVFDERHPAWPGDPIDAFWSLPSPGTVQGSDADVRAVFARVCGQLEAAVAALVDIPFGQLHAESVRGCLQHPGPH